MFRDDVSPLDVECSLLPVGSKKTQTAGAGGIGSMRLTI